MLHLVKDDPDNAAFYAGLFIASFSLAESLTAFPWGVLSDKIGRKPVMLLGCGGTLLSLLVLGFSVNVWMALIGRALGGALNGNVGVVQTMVGEIATEPKHEGKTALDGRPGQALNKKARAFIIVPMFWTLVSFFYLIPHALLTSVLGCTIGPLMGGGLAKPAEQFPDIFGDVALFVKFPFLLPNLVCAAFLIFTWILAAFLLEETHPAFSHKVKHEAQTRTQERSPLLGDSHNQVIASADTIPPKSPSERVSPLLWSVIGASCFLTSHNMMWVQLFPIFLRESRDYSVPPYYLGGIGGLGFQLAEIGLAMGVNGAIGLFFQALLFPPFAESFGNQAVFTWVTTLHPLVYFIVPYIAFISGSSGQRIAVYTWLALRNIFTSFAYPAVLIMVRQATPNPWMLGKVNGIVASTGAACRSLAPSLAGFLQTIGEEHHLRALAWWATGLVATLGAVQSWFIHMSSQPDEEEINEAAIQER